jgi:hypothetical protein
MMRVNKIPIRENKYRFLTKWCFMRSEEDRARRRLGERISYLSLYKYSEVVDKHRNEIDLIQNKLIHLEDASIYNHEQLKRL